MFDIKMQGEGVLAISGRLDASQVERAEKLLGEVQQSATADLSLLDYISSAGLGILVKTQVRLRSSGQALKLVNVHPRVRTIFHYAGLEQLFGIE